MKLSIVLCRRYITASLLAVGVGQFLVTEMKNLMKAEDNLGLPWFHPPDLPGVLRDGPVRAELAAAGDVLDGHLGPLGGVLVGGAHLLLTGDVRPVVRQGQEPVVVEQHVGDVFELVLVAWTEDPIFDQVNNLQ